MNILFKTVAAGLLVSSSVCAQQDCERPWPVEVPEVAVSKDEVLAAQKKVKQYLKDAEAYLACNDAAQKELPPEEATTAQTMRILTGLYNNTVGEMEVVAEQFNVLVRKYKENNG